MNLEDIMHNVTGAIGSGVQGVENLLFGAKQPPPPPPTMPSPMSQPGQSPMPMPLPQTPMSNMFNNIGQAAQKDVSSIANDAINTFHNISQGAISDLNNISNFTNQAVNGIHTAIKVGQTLGNMGEQDLQQAVSANLPKLNPFGDQSLFNQLSQGKFLGQPTTVPFLKPVEQEAGQYVQNRLINPIGQLPGNLGAVINPQSTVLQRGIGIAGAIGDVFNYTPTTQAIQLGQGGIYGAIKGVREGQNPLASGLQNAVAGNPVGLGSALTDNKVLATAGDIAGGFITPGLVNGIARLTKSTMMSSLKGISPNVFNMHPQDEQLATDFAYRILNKNAVGGKLSNAENTDLQNLAEHYLGSQYDAATNKQIAQAFQYALATKYNGAEYAGRLPDIKLVNGKEENVVENPAFNPEEYQQVHGTTEPIVNQTTDLTGNPAVDEALGKRSPEVANVKASDSLNEYMQRLGIENNINPIPLTQQERVEPIGQFEQMGTDSPTQSTAPEGIPHPQESNIENPIPTVKPQAQIRAEVQGKMGIPTPVDQRAKINELQNIIANTKSENSARAQLAQEARSIYSTSQLQDIAKLKRLYATTKAFQEGDIETMRQSKYAPLVNSIVERVKENYPNITSDDEALDKALSTPTQAEIVIPRLWETKELKEAQSRYKAESEAFEKEFGRPATPAEQQQLHRESTQALFNQLGASKKLSDQKLNELMAIDASKPIDQFETNNIDEYNPSEQRGNNNINQILSQKPTGKISSEVRDENGVLLGKVKRSPIGQPLSKVPPGQETKNKVNLTIQGKTLDERVKSAIGNSDYVAESITQRGIDAETAGRKLDSHDIKLLEQYQHGTPIETLASQAHNPKQFTKALNKIIDYYDYRLAVDRSLGGQTARRENYIPQSWDLSRPEDLERFNQLAAQKGITPWDGFRAQPRVFNTYAEGEAAGFKRLNPNILDDLKDDYGAASNRLSQVALKQGLEQAAPDMVSSSGTGKTSEGKPFINQNIPGIEGLSLHPDLMHKLQGYTPLTGKDLFQQIKEKGFVQGLKDTGTLNTLASLWDHGTTPMKKVLWEMSGFHNLNITGSVAGKQLFSPKSLPGLLNEIPGIMSEKYMQHLIQGTKDALIPGKDYSLFEAGLRSGALKARSSPLTGLNKFNLMEQSSRAVFDRGIYSLQLNLVKSVFGDGKIDPESPLGRQLGMEIQTLTGSMNAHMQNVNPNWLKAGSRLLLAPGFTISKYTMLKHATIGGGNRAFATQAVIGKSVLFGILSTFGTLLATGKFPALQQVLLNFTAAPTIQTNLTNPKGHKYDIGFPQTFLSEPLKPVVGPGGFTSGSNQGLTQYARARLNPLLSLGLEAYTNQDFYGNPLVDNSSQVPASQQLFKNIGVGLLPIGGQNIAKVAMGQMTPLQAAINIFGLQTHTSPNDPTVVYFANQAAAKQSLNNVQQAQFTALYAREHDANGNVITLSDNQKRADAAMRYANPAIVAAETQAAILTSQQTGQPLNPLYTYTPAQQKIILEEESQLPGPEKTGAVKANPALFNDYFAKENVYYQQLQASGVKLTQGNNPSAPIMSAYVLSQMNAKNYNDPLVQQYFTQDLQYKNAVRAQASAPLIDSYGNMQGSAKYGVPYVSASAKSAARRGMMRDLRYTTKKSNTKVAGLLAKSKMTSSKHQSHVLASLGRGSSAPTVRLHVSTATPKAIRQKYQSFTLGKRHHKNTAMPRVSYGRKHTFHLV